MFTEVLSWIWIVPALPLATALILLLFGRRMGEPNAGLFVVGTLAVSFIGSVLALVELVSLPGAQRQVSRTLFTWISAGRMHVDASFLVDPLSVTMILFVTGISTLIAIYSIAYMHGDPRYSRFFAYLSLFVGSMLVLVLGGSFLVTFVGWEGVGLCSYLLISFWFERPSAARAGKKAFITNRVGDLGFLLAMFMIFDRFGTLDYLPVLDNVKLLDRQSATLIAVFLFIGACGKSAQMPLHIWLPDAMEGPTPVSALIHAATMVTAGVFLMVRSHAFLDVSPGAAFAVTIVGVITAFVAATVALVHHDIKRVLAYSTVSQLGFMFIAVGVGAYEAAIFHMVTHAFFKALLFLGAGSVIHGLGDEQDMRKMGGLRKFMPITSGAFIVGWLAIAGVAPFAGFWSKDEILAKLWVHGDYAIWAMTAMTALLTAFYMTRQVFLVFYGNERWASGDGHDHEPHESPATMTGPLIVLAGLAVVGGALNLPFHSLEMLGHWLHPALEGAPEIAAPSFMSGATLAVAALSLSLCGIAGGWWVYRKGLDLAEEDPVHAKLGKSVVIFERAWFIDERISDLVGGPGRWLAAKTATTVDQAIIDGAVSTVGLATTGAGGILRSVQSGRIRTYALMIAIGVLVLLMAVIVRVGL